MEKEWKETYIVLERAGESSWIVKVAEWSSSFKVMLLFCNLLTEMQGMPN